MAKVARAERDALRLIGSGPVVFLTTMFRDQPNVMTAGWLLPLSLDPVLIGVAVQPSRLSHEFMTKSEQFAISLPTMDSLAAIHGCGETSGRDGDKFERFGLTPQDPHEIEAPLIGECVAHIECGVIDRVHWGDHDLFVGSVLHVSADPLAFRETWLPEDGVQIVHHLGGDRYAGMGAAYRASAPPDDDSESG